MICLAAYRPPASPAVVAKIGPAQVTPGGLPVAVSHENLARLVALPPAGKAFTGSIKYQRWRPSNMSGQGR